MAFQVRIKPRAQKEFDNLERKDRIRVSAILLDISRDPFSGKKLEGEFGGCYAIRVWPIRIIYQIYKKELLVLVIRIRHRQGSYK